MRKISELMEKLEIKEKEIKEIKSKIPFVLWEGEHLMTIIFTSIDQKKPFAIICKNTDQFTRLENELYKEPEYKDYNDSDNYFLFNGTKIKRNYTLEENRIKNNSLIIICKNE